VATLRLQRRWQRVGESLLGHHRHAVGAEGLRQLLPVDAAELHAVRRDALGLLLDAMKPICAVCNSATVIRKLRALLRDPSSYRATMKLQQTLCRARSSIACRGAPAAYCRAPPVRGPVLRCALRRLAAIRFSLAGLSRADLAAVTPAPRRPSLAADFVPPQQPRFHANIQRIGSTH
jgi:hypothetical protein